MPAFRARIRPIAVAVGFCIAAPLVTYAALMLRGFPSFVSGHPWIILGWAYSVTWVPAVLSGVILGVAVAAVVRRTDSFHAPYDFGRCFSLGAIVGAIAEAFATTVYRVVSHRGFSDFWIGGSMISGCLAGAVVVPIVLWFTREGRGAAGNKPGAAGGQPENEVRILYRALLRGWDRRDAKNFAALCAADATLIGFDGSPMYSRSEIEAELTKIFSLHATAPFVSVIRTVRFMTPETAVLTAVAGMLNKDKTDIDPALNAVQSMAAALDAGRWRVTHFQNTPAAFHGRPEMSRALTEELRRIARPA
jgi:uncharacterized protein (TIGR02246 family)